jgi:fructose-1,6-bisphosphatase/inositol monophosphatase family enzyme
MNGDSRRNFAVALASFAAGAAVAAVLGNPKAREKLTAHGKRAAERSKKLLRRAEK